jgi:hypothetical protein
MGSCRRNYGENTDVLTCGGTTSTTFASIAFELDAIPMSSPGVNFQDPGYLMKGIRRAWHRRRSGIFVPDIAYA